MNRKSGSGAGVFLMEMIFVVFFFMICASTCILAFAKSDRMSRLASDRNRAVSAAQSVAEIWKLEGMDGLMERMYAHEVPDGAAPAGSSAVSGNHRQVCWDKNWKCIDAQTENRTPDLKYIADLSESVDGEGMRKLWICVGESEADGTPALFELEVSRYERAVK